MTTLVLSQTRKSGFHDKILYETPSHIAILYSGQRTGRDDRYVVPHAVGGKFIREVKSNLRECLGTILSAADIGKTVDGCRQFILVIEKAPAPLRAETKSGLLALLGLSVKNPMTGIALAVKTDSALTPPVSAYSPNAHSPPPCLAPRRDSCQGGPSSQDGGVPPRSE